MLNFAENLRILRYLGVNSKFQILWFLGGTRTLILSYFYD